MSDAIEIEGVRLPLAIVPQGKPWQVSLSPIVEGEMGRENVLVYQTAHLGYGDSRKQAQGRYHWGYGIDPRTPRLLHPGLRLEQVSLGSRNSARVFFDVDMGSGVRRLYIGAETEFVWMDTGYNITASLTFTQSRAYAATYYPASGSWSWYVSGIPTAYTQSGKLITITAEPIYRLTPGTPDSWAASTSITAWLVASVPGSSGTTFHYSRGNQLRWLNAAGDDPISASEQTATTASGIGHPDAFIRRLQTLGEVLVVGKDDGLYGKEGAPARWPGLLPDLQNQIDKTTDGGRALVAWQGELYYNHMRGYIRYRPGMAQYVGPERHTLNESPIRGYVTAAVPYGQWLFAAVYNGTDSYILRGQKIEDEVIWLPLAQIQSTKVLGMAITEVWPEPRLVIGSQLSVLYFMRLPKYEWDYSSSDVLTALSGSIYFPEDDGGTPRTMKLLQSVSLYAQDVDANNYFTPYVRADWGDWQRLDDVKATGYVTVKASGIAGRTIGLRIDMTSDGTKRPSIRMPILVRYIEAPAVARVHEFVVSVGEPRTAFDMWQSIAGLVGRTVTVRLPDQSVKTAVLTQAQPVRLGGVWPRESVGMIAIRLRELSDA